MAAAPEPERLVADPPEHNAARSVAGAGIGEAVVENQVLLAALAALPERQRAAVVLRHWCDLSAAETAETMGCTIGTVKSSTSKGLAHLRAASALTGTSSWKESSSGETSRVLLSGSGVPAVAGEADLDGDGASEVPVLSRERDRESWTVLTVAEGGVVAAVPVGP